MSENKNIITKLKNENYYILIIKYVIKICINGKRKKKDGP